MHKSHLGALDNPDSLIHDDGNLGPALLQANVSPKEVIEGAKPSQ